MTSSPPPRTDFDWSLYADATFAGLSVLVPIPFLDSAFEWFFRRRMPGAIARRRRRALAPVIGYEIVRGEQGCVEACLMLPITLTWQLVKRLSKKLLYFLTLKEASDRLSYYWHQAFLLDYMLQAGHLDDLRSAQVARQALERSLRGTRTSPLAQLAARVAPHTRHVLGSLRRARRGQEDEVIAEKKSVMAQAWADLGGYLAQVAVRYDAEYSQALAARAAAEAAARAAAEAASRQPPAAPG